MRGRNGVVRILALAFSCFFGAAMTIENSRKFSLDNETEISNPKAAILSRQKRYLVFPQGSNVQLVYCLTIGTYPRPSELVVGLTAALAWQLPSKYDKNLDNFLHRQSRSVIFPKIEAFLQSAGLDGRSCVLRALCEASQRDSAEIATGTLVQELLHAIFKLRRDGTRFEITGHRAYDRAHETNGDCSLVYPTCPYSIYDLDF